MSKNNYGEDRALNEALSPQIVPVAELSDFFANISDDDADTDFKGNKKKSPESIIAPEIATPLAEDIDSEAPEVSATPVSATPLTRREAREALKALQSLDKKKSQSVKTTSSKSKTTTSDTVAIPEIAPASEVVLVNSDVVDELVKPEERSKELVSVRRGFRRVGQLASKKEALTFDDGEKQISARAARRQIEKAIRATRTPNRVEKSSSVVTTKRSVPRRIGRILLSTTAVLSVAGFAFASAIPNFAASEAAVASQGLEVAQEANIQPLEAQSAILANYDAEALPEGIARDDYTATAPPVQRVFQRWSYHFGTFVNNPNAAIQWPFQSARISSPYGPRWGGMHTGLDFDLPDGTPIGSIASGVVLAAGWNIVGGCGYGALIDHGVIAGAQTSSLYCHMQGNSSSLAQGQQVTAGTVVGRVGSTGMSLGSHLHLEIWKNGSPFGGGGTWADPYAWLSANAG